MKSRLKKVAYMGMDVGSRDAAVSYINGNVYQTETHSEAAKQYYEENNSRKAPKYLNEMDRPDQSELESAGIDEVAFAHLLEEGGNEEEDDNGEVYEVPAGVYIDRETVSGVDINTAAKAFKEKYPGLDIFEYDTWEILDDGKHFKRIARKIR